MNPLKIFLLIIFYCPILFSQEIEWEKVSLGISTQYNVLSEDFGEYWENSFGFGANLEYEISENFSLEGDIFLSKFNPKKANDFPDIILISIPGGLKYYLKPTNWLSLNLFTGLENSTFAFNGEAAKKVYQNTTESEFGYFISFGSQFKIHKRKKVELFTKALVIFSSPDYIYLYNVGIKFFIL